MTSLKCLCLSWIRLQYHEGRISVDFICRFENINNDFSVVCENLVKMRLYFILIPQNMATTVNITMMILLRLSQNTLAEI
jgi:hypothetical protein